MLSRIFVSPCYTEPIRHDITDHRRGAITIHPLESDLGYFDNGDTPIGSKDYLDPSSFRFWTDEYLRMMMGNFVRHW
ncbi:hypothetical protein M1P97_06425 [Parabacteroides sp. GYB001]|uniref:hypothetical protein n=1 Tax=Parabacteroides leei TaxID=2939491 RepID=UPI00201807FF|nr:hypothetical protein [Parabacteroides leei]MCL3850920.1 hypothetical protein [Parabacteroides leei]